MNRFDLLQKCLLVMLSPLEKRAFSMRVLNPNLGYPDGKALRKKMLEKAKKTTTCLNCREINGTVKKAGLLKIVLHKKYKSKKKSDGRVQQRNAEENQEPDSILQSGMVHILNPSEVNEKKFKSKVF